MREFEACAMMMPQLNAEMVLQGMSISMYPHAKTEYRTKMHRSVYTVANPATEDAAASSMESFATMLGGGPRG